MTPREEALAILRRDLTPEAHGALAHLLNNALCPVVVEVNPPDGELHLGDLRVAVADLVALVREVLS